MNIFIPDMGLIQEFLNSSKYFTLTTATGVFIEKPKVPLAFGKSYFFILAYLDLKLGNETPKVHPIFHGSKTKKQKA